MACFIRSFVQPLTVWYLIDWPIEAITRYIEVFESRAAVGDVLFQQVDQCRVLLTIKTNGVFSKNFNCSEFLFNIHKLPDALMLRLLRPVAAFIGHRCKIVIRMP